MENEFAEGLEYELFHLTIYSRYPSDHPDKIKLLNALRLKLSIYSPAF